MEINPLKINKTRFSELGFARIGSDWRFMDLTGSQPAQVGPYYKRKDELLADLTRYATEYGCTV